MAGAASDEETAEAESSAQDAGTHQFHFAAFEQVSCFLSGSVLAVPLTRDLQKFATEGVLATLMSYLARYRTFTFEYQIKNVVKLLHRQAVKAKAVALFFKASVLNLFRQILDDRKVLPKSRPWADLVTLIQFILKEFFKAARYEPILLIEVREWRSRVQPLLTLDSRCSTLIARRISRT